MIGTRGTYCAKRLLKALLMQAFLFATLITPRGPTGGSVAGALKIAVYSHSLPPEVDGVSRRFSMLIEEFKRRGHEVFVFTLEKDLELKGVEPVTLLDFATGLAAYPTKKIGKPGWSELCKITDVLKAEKPDVLHVTNDALSSQFVLAARFAGIPIVGSIHTDVIRILEAVGSNTAAKMLVAFKESNDAFLFDGCGTTSKSFRAKLLSNPSVPQIGKLLSVECPFIVPTSADTTIFKPVPNDEVRSRLTFGDPNALLAVYVGRLGIEKGIKGMIEWVTAAPNAYVAIIGDGPMAPELIALHGKKNRVYCVPGFMSHEELAPVYSSADIHVSASIFETLGNTVLEAQACGTPVVVPHTQGFKDTVIHGEDGFLYQPDMPQQATEFVARLANDRALLKKMSAQAIKKITTSYTIEATADEIVGWYHESIARRNANPRTWMDGVLMYNTFAQYPVWAVYQLFMGMKARFACAILAVVTLGLFYFVGFLYRCVAGVFGGGDEGGAGEAEEADKKEQ